MWLAWNNTRAWGVGSPNSETNRRVEQSTKEGMCVVPTMGFTVQTHTDTPDRKQQAAGCKWGTQMTSKLRCLFFLEFFRGSADARPLLLLHRSGS